MSRLITFSIITFLWMLGSASFLHAQIQIDNFFDDTADLVAPGSPSSEITNNIEGSGFDREIFVQSGGAFSIISTVTSGVLVVDAGGSGSGSASATFEYLNLPSGGLDIGANTFFQLNVGKVIGSPLVGLELTSEAAPGDTLTGAVQLIATDNPLSFYIDLTQLSGYSPAFVAQLDSITFFIADSDEDFFVEGNSVQFTSVPEPGTCALLAAGLSLLAWRKRRQAS